jgi:hypothetical protein
MKNNIVLLFLILFISSPSLMAQVSVNSSGASPDPSAMLDVNAPNKGVLIPRVVLNAVSDNINPVNNPAPGLMVYNTGGNLAAGLYIWSGSNWSVLATMENVINAIPPSQPGVYGEIHEYYASGSSVTVNVSTSGVYAPWTTGDEGDVSGMTFNNSTLIIEQDGVYHADFNASVKAGGGKVIDAALFVNGVRQDDMHTRTWGKEGGKSYTLSFSGIIALEGDDVVSVRFTFQNGTGSIDLEMANLNLQKID